MPAGQGGGRIYEAHGVARVVKVGFRGPSEDLTVRKIQEVGAIATLGEVQGHGALSVGSGVRDQWRQRVGPGHRRLRKVVHRRRECSWTCGSGCGHQ